mmetsp:Transcript_96846/g.289259  ORF Transcript_96846/g.289259 Transcript_96846/m.289259 type:complete len:375 (-) Transcript_96846:15-1139(-)
MQASTPGRQPRRLALVLANGAYTHRAKLSRPVGVASELRRKLSAMGFEVVGADDQDLTGMRAATRRWLGLVEAAVDEVQAEAEEARAMEVATGGALAGCPGPPLLIFFTFCGHGRAGRFMPVDCPRPAADEDSFGFFEDFLFRLYEVLGGRDLLRPKRPAATLLKGVPLDGPDVPNVPMWQPPGVHVIAVIESCRRLAPEEQKAYEEQRAHISHGKRHLLPCVAAARPDLAHMGGAEWDAARLAFLARLGRGAPQLLLALSSESTTPSYDVVFLRSITEAVDKPVRLGGILERASLDTLRRTGYKQKPVILDLGGGLEGPPPQDLILAAPEAAPSPPRRSSMKAFPYPSLKRSHSVPARRALRTCAQGMLTPLS